MKLDPDSNLPTNHTCLSTKHNVINFARSVIIETLSSMDEPSNCIVCLSFAAYFSLCSDWLGGAGFVVIGLVELVQNRLVSFSLYPLTAGDQHF